MPSGTPQSDIDRKAIARRIGGVVGRKAVGTLAEELGVSPATASRVLSGQREPSAGMLKALLTVYGVNPAWILTGEGQPTVAGAVPYDPRRAAEDRERLNLPPLPPQRGDYGPPVAVGEPEASGYEVVEILEPGQSVITREVYEGLPPEERRLYVPIVGVAACGQAVERSADHPAGWADEFAGLTRPARDPGAFAVRLAGQSMEPGYRDGDLVLVGPNWQPLAGEPAVIVFRDDTATFKLWTQDRRSGTIRLWATNPAFAPRTVDAATVRRVLPLLEHMPLMVVKPPG